MSDTHCGLHKIRLFDISADPTRPELRCIVCFRDALNSAAYALFQIKRLVDAGPVTREFAAARHAAACKVLDGE